MQNLIKQMNKQGKKTKKNRFLNTENKPVVARGEEDGQDE